MCYHRWGLQVEGDLKVIVERKFADGDMLGKNKYAG
jgi:hypothetical protein